MKGQHLTGARITHIGNGCSKCDNCFICSVKPDCKCPDGDLVRAGTKVTWAESKKIMNEEVEL